MEMIIDDLKITPNGFDLKDHERRRWRFKKFEFKYCLDYQKN